MTECLWSILLLDMFYSGVKLEDVIDGVTNYYRQSQGPNSCPESA